MDDIIVIGGNHHNTLGVIRSLGEKGLFPTLIIVSSNRRPFVSYSKYLKRTLRIERNEMIPETLLDQCKNVDVNPVVICCSDSSASIIDENRDRLSPFFVLPGAQKQGIITHFMSKRIMSDLALEVGMRIPRSFYGADIAEQKIPLPCIIKPLISKNGFKSDIHICYTWDEVNDYSLKIGSENIQIQQFINKEYEYQLIGCSTGNDVIIPGVSIILRPCKGSNTAFLHYIPLDKSFCDIDRCYEFIRRIGYNGLFSLEFIRDKSGTDYFMEMNFRNDGNAICVTASGVNLPYIWYLACRGKDIQEEKNRKVSPVYVMPDSAEMKLLLSGQISLFQYLGDIVKTDRFMEFDRKDPVPFWKMITNR